MSQHSILLVDDSPSILKALRRTFELEDWETICVPSASEALKTLADRSVDVIISDETMPEISGTELLERVRELYPSIIRMMLTGATDIEVAKRAINQGAIYRFFTKPWQDHELLLAIMHALKVRDLEIENSKLKSSVRKQEHLLQDLESQYPGITERRLTEDGAIIID